MELLTGPVGIFQINTQLLSAHDHMKKHTLSMPAPGSLACTVRWVYLGGAAAMLYFSTCTWTGEESLALSLIIKGHGREENWLVLATDWMFSFCFGFHRYTEILLQACGHLTWKITITAITVLTLRAFMVQEGILIPVSQKTHALLGPAGFTWDFSPVTIGQISTSQNPLPAWTLIDLIGQKRKLWPPILSNALKC